MGWGEPGRSQQMVDERVAKMRADLLAGAARRFLDEGTPAARWALVDALAHFDASREQVRS